MTGFEEFENTKGIIRIRKLKTERQHNDPKKKDQRTNNDQQKIDTSNTQKDKRSLSLLGTGTSIKSGDVN
jgi:hypothetical protein